MKKKTLADKIADKAFENPKFKAKWDEMMTVFGPIVQDAFVDNSQIRVHLANAINNISGGDLKKAIGLLEKVKEAVETEADEACWLFFMGLVFDVAGMTDNMLEYYIASCQRNHTFYMPYMKVAKDAYAKRAFDAAEDYFKKTLYCFTVNDLMDDGPSQVIIASVYTHLAAVLTSMHRYEEAYEFITLSENTILSQAGRNATKAVLCAAMGKTDELEEAISELKKDSPQFLEDTEKIVNKILNKTDAGFFDIGTDENEIASFWAWFTENEKDFYGMLTQERFEEFFALLGERLKAVFPFMLETLEFGIEEAEESYRILFADFYAVTLANGYKNLIESAPEELKERWEFDICR